MAVAGKGTNTSSQLDYLTMPRDALQRESQSFEYGFGRQARVGLTGYQRTIRTESSPGMLYAELQLPRRGVCPKASPLRKARLGPVL